MKIKFLTESRFKGIIPEPYPAQQYLPTWYKNLPHRVGRQGLHDGTIKRCAPFLDSMSQGWIIPLAADIQIEQDGEGGFETDADFDDQIVGSHPPFQVGDAAHPSHPSPLLKFSNYWAMQVPRGWSVLFVPPLNRPDPRFECFSGVVDCDKYFNYVNFPFFMKDLYFSGIIKQGTPIIQAIPFEREDMRSSVSVMTTKEVERLDTTKRKLKAHVSFYRDDLWKQNLPSSCPFKRFFSKGVA